MKKDSKYLKPGRFEAHLILDRANLKHLVVLLERKLNSYPNV